jgi:hypothetical protein
MRRTVHSTASPSSATRCLRRTAAECALASARILAHISASRNIRWHYIRLPSFGAVQCALQLQTPPMQQRHRLIDRVSRRAHEVRRLREEHMQLE